MENLKNRITTDLDLQIDKEYVKSLITQLKNDAEVFDIILSEFPEIKNDESFLEKNIIYFVDFMNQYNICKNCKGTSYCEKDPPCTELNLKNAGYVRLCYSPCKLAINKLKRNSLYYIRDFNEDWLNVTTKMVDSEIKKEVLSEYAIIKKNLSLNNNSSKNWIFVKGKPLSGKSFVLATIANDFVNNFGQAAFLDFVNFVNKIDESYRNKDYDSINYKKLVLTKIPLLVIDNFGDETKSDFVRDNIVLGILNERNRNHLPTFFASRYSINEIVSLYSTFKNTEIKAKQIKLLIESNINQEIDLSLVTY